MAPRESSLGRTELVCRPTKEVSSTIQYHMPGKVADLEISFFAGGKHPIYYPALIFSVKGATRKSKDDGDNGSLVNMLPPGYTFSSSKACLKKYILGTSPSHFIRPTKPSAFILSPKKN